MKNLKNLGKTLNKQEQKKIHGGCPGCGSGPINDDGTGGGSGGGSGSGSTCPTGFCTPGKCWDTRWCRCRYGQGTGTNQNGVCIDLL